MTNREKSSVKKNTKKALKNKLHAFKVRKVKNPFVGMEGYRCFGCSPDNQYGLNLSFTDEGEYLTSEWEPREYFQGYNNVLHGGIQATLMDEIASWYVYAKLKTAGVTSKMEVRYKKPVYINKGGKLKLRAKLQQQRRNLADFYCELFDSDGQLCAYAQIQYFVFPDKIAKERYFYPGPEKFFDNE